MTNFFPCLTAAPILRHLTTFTPGGGAILEAITGVGEATTIRDYLRNLRGDAIMCRFEDLTARDLEGRRDMGDLLQLQADEDFGFISAWNRFAGSMPGTAMDVDDRALLCGPALRRIEAQFVNIATRAKNARGRIRDHHVDREIEPSTIDGRLAGAEAELIASLAGGDTTDFGIGQPTTREKPGAAKALFRAGQPVIMVRRAGAKNAWHEVELRHAPQVKEVEEEVQVDTVPEPSETELAP